nr:venom peptide [Acharia stimulea]
MLSKIVLLVVALTGLVLANPQVNFSPGWGQGKR